MEGILIGLVLAAGLLLVYGFASQYFLKTEYYTVVSEKLREDRTIVLLADLHGCHHGRENEKLLAEIKKEAPDIICIAGDMTVKNGKHTGEMISLLAKLKEISPVFYAPGNHEIRMPEYEAYRDKLRQRGICYLENESVLFGEDIQITGLDLPEYWYHKCWQRRRMTREILEEQTEPLAGEYFSLLLAHNPEYFPQYAKWGADLVLSGHLHGGIARLPLFGGVISPSLRLFPRYDAGEFEMEGSRMIISRGLGLHHIKLRFFNSPEISVIKLKSENVL